MSDQSKKLILEGTEIICPKVDGRYTLIDLRTVSAYEARLDEIAIVTKHKAPELLAMYNRAYLEVCKMSVTLEAELAAAERQRGEIRSKIILDEVPRILKEKGLATAKSPAGSEDLRSAVLDGDTKYQDAVELCEQIRCVIVLLRGKQKAFENAYTAVKKIMGEDAFDHHPNPRLSAGESNVPVGNTALDTLCSICNERQFETPSGDCCPNGHGGAAGIVLLKVEDKKKVSGWGTPKY